MSEQRKQKRCEEVGCDKSAQGSTSRCIAHGGGRRCEEPGCDKGAIGSTSRCTAHGGGKRCEEPGCDKGACGSTGRCINHGRVNSLSSSSFFSSSGGVYGRLKRMGGSIQKKDAKRGHISGSSSSSSSSLDGGGDYGSVIGQAAEATTTTTRNCGKRAVSSCSSCSEVSSELRAQGDRERRGRVAAVATVESEDVSRGGVDDEGGGDFTDIWV